MCWPNTGEAAGLDSKNGVRFTSSGSLLCFGRAARGPMCWPNAREAAGFGIDHEAEVVAALGALLL